MCTSETSSNTATEPITFSTIGNDFQVMRLTLKSFSVFVFPFHHQTGIQVLHFNVHYWNGCVSLWVCVICFFVHLITQEPNIFRLHIINSLVSTLSISIQFNYHNNNYFRCSISDMVVLSLVSLDYIWLWTCRWLVLFLVFFVKIDSRSTFQCEINGDIYIYDTFLARKMGFWSVWRVHILRKCIEFHYFIAGP